MTVDEIRTTLAADDYHLTVVNKGDSVEVRIAAGPDACADCLIPKPLMRAMLGDALAVPEHTINLRYPTDT
jgi:hypothetical protein